MRKAQQTASPLPLSAPYCVAYTPMSRAPCCAAGRWEARIGIPGSRHIYLGLYNEEREVR